MEIFKGRCEKDLTSNQLTVVTEYRNAVIEEVKLVMIVEILDGIVDLGRGCYHGAYVLLHFNKEGGSHRKEHQEKTKADPDEENMEDVRLNDERERHWRVVPKNIH